MKKKDREQKKVNALSLTVDDMDWQDQILTGKISSLYVAQLNLCLEHKMLMTSRDIKCKGFTHAKKIETIKRHVLEKPQKTSSDVSHVANKKIVTLPASFQSKRPTFNQQLRILPWGGKNLNFELANTCPMDNFLFILHT